VYLKYTLKANRKEQKDWPTIKPEEELAIDPFVNPPK
jgi:hypothetical protein